MNAPDVEVRVRTWMQRVLPLAAAVAVGVAGACGSDDPGTGPEPVDEVAALRALALAAGLAPVPDEPVRPVENPYRVEKVELGRLLFFDPILSGPMDVACSTCHLPRFAFADGRQFPSGAGGVGLGPERSEPPPPMRPMERNSPTVFNAGVYGRMSTQPTTNGTMFWGGGAFGIEDQALNPIAADKELRGTTYPKVHAIDSVLTRLRSIDGYVDRFADAYPEIFDVYGREPTRLVTATTLRRALAAYVRELITPDAPLDRFLEGDDQALSARAQAGLRLFVEKGGCVGCHTGPLLSDFSMHVLGARQEGLGRDTTLGDDLGWGEHGGKLYSFRTPPLRQVELTAPYFHAGTATTLEEVVRFKSLGISEHAAVAASDLDSLLKPLALTDDEVLDLITFMAALTDRTTIAGPLFQAPPDVPSGMEVPR
jgi:cytochrome c peroxidase